MRNPINAAIAAILLIGIIVGGAQRETRAAEFTTLEAKPGAFNVLSGQRVREIYMFGQIVAGDAQKLKALLNGHFVIKLWILSQGGDVIEAVKIAELLDKNLMWVNAPLRPELLSIGERQKIIQWHCAEMGPLLGAKIEAGECVCNSACAIIWLTAPFRSGDYIGVHRPRFEYKYFSGLDSEAAKNTYREMSEYVSSLLAKNEVPESVIGKMMSTPSSEMEILSEDDIVLVGQAKPYLVELIHSRCQIFADDLLREKNLKSRQSEITAKLYSLLEDPTVTEEQIDETRRTKEEIIRERRNFRSRYSECELMEKVKLIARAQGVEIDWKH